MSPKRNGRGQMMSEAEAKAALDVELKKRATQCMNEIQESLRHNRCQIEAEVRTYFDGRNPILVWDVQALP